MTTQHNQDLAEPFLSDQAVEDYLRTHPDFFVQHENLLAVLEVPHPVHGAVSLVEHQIKVLRDQNRQFRRKLMDLVQVARDNDRLGAQMHNLTLALMGADSLEQVLMAVSEALRDDFQADGVVIGLFTDCLGDARPDQALSIQRDDPALQYFDTFFERHRPVCGRVRDEQLAFLFGDSADAMNSAALVPIGDDPLYGVIAIASFDAERFHPAMGTVFLSRLGELTALALHPYLGAAS